jgi:hypothetical protein
MQGGKNWIGSVATDSECDKRSSTCLGSCMQNLMLSGIDSKAKFCKEIHAKQKSSHGSQQKIKFQICPEKQTKN